MSKASNSKSTLTQGSPNKCCADALAIYVAYFKALETNIKMDDKPFYPIKREDKRFTKCNNKLSHDSGIKLDKN